MPGSSQQPGRWPVIVRQGDTLEEVTWALARNGSAWTPTGATAIVRQGRNRSSSSLQTLTTSVGTGEVTGFGDVIDLRAGEFYWELSLADTNISATYRRTILAGTFTVLDDLSA